ncbi:hypothetical protein BSN85_28620 [Bradyrhizobium brasilense]|nr:hypothetical protein BSN85_28620 [Bradyrhizobium brasilense]
MQQASMMNPEVPNWLIGPADMHLHYEYDRRDSARAMEKSFSKFAKRRPQIFCCGPAFRQHAKNDGSICIRQLLSLVIQRIFDCLDGKTLCGERCDFNVHCLPVRDRLKIKIFAPDSYLGLSSYVIATLKKHPRGIHLVISGSKISSTHSTTKLREART